MWFTLNLPHLQSAFRTSPAISLLKSQNAAYIIDFLHGQFKAEAQQSILEEDLRVALADYQENIREMDPSALPEGASQYLTNWTSRQFLSRSFQRGESGSGDAFFQLTSHTESAIGLLDGMLANELGFIGTESRVRLVMDSLKSLVVETSEDAGERIAQLDAERARLADEIAAIKRDGVAPLDAKARITEDYVNYYVLVTKDPESSHSELFTMSAEEFRELELAESHEA